MNKVKTYEEFINEEINLKKALTGAALGASLAFSNPAKSQITSTEIPKPISKEVTQTPYDSTENNIGDNIGSLIGQDLYFIGDREYAYTLSSRYGYDRDIEFYTDINKIGDISKCELLKNISGKYFRLVSVSEDTLHPKYQKSSTNYYVLKLEEKESKKVYYQRYNEYQKVFPFIIVGFYDKIKQKYIGSILNIEEGSPYPELTSFKKNGEELNISGGLTRNWINRDKVSNDLKTGRYITNLTGDWICKDVTTNNGKIVLVFENSDKSFFIEYDYLISNEKHNNKISRSSSSGGCLSEDALIELYSGSKKISDIKPGDKVKTNDGYAIVKKLHFDNVVDISVVSMGKFYMTPSHPILIDGSWMRADEFGKSENKKLDRVYNIELLDGDTFIANGIICASLITMKIGNQEILLSRCILTKDDFITRRVKYFEVDPGKDS
jgi:hypothetical protein